MDEALQAQVNQIWWDFQADQYATEHADSYGAYTKETAANHARRTRRLIELLGEEAGRNSRGPA